MLVSVTTMAEGYSGKIISGNKLQGLADATIQLFNNNVFVGGCKSKTDGYFSVNTSQKATRISVSYVGLESYTRKDSLGLPENLGVIALSTHNVGLKEVTVTGTLKQETCNKDIYLITDSMRKGTASSGQLLEKIPGFLRDWENDKLRVNGEEDIVLLVNDVEKSSDYAMRINPKRIKKVEITYNPTGKYEGRRMLLNLSLFDDYIGWDFVPYTNLQYGKNNMNQETVGGSYTYSVNKLSFNITSAFSNVVNKESDSFTRMYADNYEEVLKNSILVIQIKSAKNWGMTYLLVLNINWLRGIVFLFRPKELLISPWILPCTLLRRRTMGVCLNMNN